MKTNYLLLLILSIMLGITYYVEEVYKANTREKAQADKSLFQPKGQISSLKTQYFELEKNDTKWRFKKISWDINQNKIDSLINILKKLKYSHVLDQIDPSAFAKSENIKITTELGEQFNYDIGVFSTVTGSFYMRDNINQKKYIVKNTAHLNEVYSNEVELESKKYLNLLRLLEYKKYYFERKIFFDPFFTKLTSVKFDSRRNKNFTLDLEQNLMEPKPLNGVKSTKLKVHINHLLSEVVLEDVYGPGRYILSDKVSELTFASHESSRVFSLFLGLNGEYGHYLRETGKENIFRVDKKTSKLFLLSAQDFWNKKIDYNVEFEKVKKIDFEVKINNEPFVKFYIEDLESFEVLTNSKKVSFISKVHMNFLFNLILNLTEFSQAKYILEDSKLENSDVEVKIFNKNIRIKIDDAHIVLFDTELGLKYFYDYNKKQINSGFFKKLFDINGQKNMVK